MCRFFWNSCKGSYDVVIQEVIYVSTWKSLFSIGIAKGFAFVALLVITADGTVYAL